ncbi:beta-ketoacyl synthase N-terminal-like domain-containing protein [Actinomadura keratinilytica]
MTSPSWARPSGCPPPAASPSSVRSSTRAGTPSAVCRKNAAARAKEPLRLVPRPRGRVRPRPLPHLPREAPLIDPQARIVYETVWEALEDGGRTGQRAEDSTTGLWIAYSHDHYHEERVRHGAHEGAASAWRR